MMGLLEDCKQFVKLKCVGGLACKLVLVQWWSCRLAWMLTDGVMLAPTAADDAYPYHNVARFKHGLILRPLFVS
jgi:hypothetical protein